MRLTTKGQVTIPQTIRDRLGLLPWTATITADVMAVIVPSGSVGEWIVGGRLGISPHPDRALRERDLDAGAVERGLECLAQRPLETPLGARFDPHGEADRDAIGARLDQNAIPAEPRDHQPADNAPIACA